jgi:hypothetical protein
MRMQLYQQYWMSNVRKQEEVLIQRSTGVFESLKKRMAIDNEYPRTRGLKFPESANHLSLRASPLFPREGIEG